MVVVTNEQLNSLKFKLLADGELANALRKIFKTVWDKKFGPSEIWDDSELVRKSFLAKEGRDFSKRVPTHKSYEEWDCTALSYAINSAKSFAIPDSSGVPRTPYDLYLRHLGLPQESFHSSVESPNGIPEETRALAVDQLRRLRNWQAHKCRNHIDKVTFDQNIQRTKEAFEALGISAKEIEELGNLPESELPTSQNIKMKKERDVAYRVVLLN
ncbi:uncharacterized protein LOC141889007 isoform X1 [Acropora palmata]|uniref:uncharacterized protein LOC141889007 isoform X1 n=1 Tax=Acropora palmata TaxID=6131 RepID=UPI003DA0FA7E